jgi:release factor glutamine methyltransferase
MSEVWTIGRVVKWATEDFRAKGLDSPRLDAELLLGHVLSMDRIKILINAEQPLSPPELARYRDLIKRRRVREPVAYLLGQREFFGRNFLVGRGVLIPRPDTETLVEVGLARSAEHSLFARHLDLCTGSGCVAITIARERPTWHVDATDLSPDALGIARQNALRLGAVWNFRLLEGDLFAPLGAPAPTYHLITSNPPYIPDAEVDQLEPGIRDFEPRMALAGGTDGLAISSRIIRQAPPWLLPGGVLALEIMAGTSEQLLSLLEQSGFVELEMKRDYAGHDRVVSGRKPA